MTEMTEPIIYDSFQDFVNKNKDIVFRYWVYKRIFTPYEQDKRFEDESIFESQMCEMAYIRECIPLPNGDFLLGFESEEMAHKEGHHMFDYYKLSNICLGYCQIDQEEDEE